MNITELKAKAARLMRGALKHAGKAGLAAALVPLGAVTAQGAAVLISSSVTPSGNNFVYSFTLNGTSFNSSGNLAKILVPLFNQNDVTNILDAGGWTHSFTTPAAAGWSYTTSSDPSLIGNPSKYGPNPVAFNTPSVILEWTDSSYLGSGASGFGFTSAFDGTNSPFVYSEQSYGTRNVDPLTPWSSSRMAAQGVPEPSTLVLFVTAGSALAAVGLLRRRGRAEA